MTKVGDRLWTYPYGRPEKVGDQQGLITGETKFSWLIRDPEYSRYKVSKNNMLLRLTHTDACGSILAIG